MPLRSVTVLESHVRHAPRSLSLTHPSSKPRNSMSPPSSWIAGRMRVSSSSLIMLTTSLSSSSAIRLSCSTPSPGAPSTLLTIGRPELTASVMSEKISGLM